MIELINYTSLRICAHAIRTCWQSHERSDGGGPKDKALIDKVGNKFKHSSTLEHLRLTWVMDTVEIVRLFKENDFSIVTEGKKPHTWVVSTNVRALQQMRWDPHTLLRLLPEEYDYLFGLPKVASELPCATVTVYPNQRSQMIWTVDLERLKEATNDYEPHVFHTFYVQGVSRGLLQELTRHRIASPSVKSSRYTLGELKDELPIAFHRKDLVEKYCVMTGDPRVDRAIFFALKNLQELIKDGVPNDIAKSAIPDAYKTELTWTIGARSLQNFLTLRNAPSAWWEIRRLAPEVYHSIRQDHQYMFTDYLRQEK